MSGYFIDAGVSRAAADREFAEIASALNYSRVSPSSPSLSGLFLSLLLMCLFMHCWRTRKKKEMTHKSRSTEADCFVRMLQHGGGGWRFLH